MIHESCPGVQRFKTPTLEEKICPECGNIIEIFSTDISVACDKCGFVAYNDMQSCVSWCAHAKECFGEEMYYKLTGKSPEDDKQTKEEGQS
jgi:ribosomal protein S27AE